MTHPLYNYPALQRDSKWRRQAANTEARQR
jgi:hypothetical protein